MRLLIIAYLLFSLTCQCKGNVLSIFPNEIKDSYTLTESEKKDFIKGINLWVRLMNSKNPTITNELTNFFDNIKETYRKDGPAEGIFAYKKTNWAVIYMSLQFDTKDRRSKYGNITYGKIRPEIILTAFSSTDFDNILKLKLMSRIKTNQSVCSETQPYSSCMDNNETLYRYLYQYLENSSITMIFDVKNSSEKNTSATQYAENFSDIWIDIK
ncbi:hypothetical protein [Atlantibacter subterraneus]|nr:hypothetical protein [Atlantibacter subterranea]MDA3134858.1 hypothetical protein [Atlantibacter subterranea]